MSVRTRLLRGNRRRFPREINGDWLGAVLFGPQGFHLFYEVLRRPSSFGLGDGCPRDHEEALGFVLEDAG